MEHAKPKADRSELRKFGLVVGAAFAVIGGVRWWLKGDPPEVLFSIAAVLVLLGAIAPAALGPVFRIWMKLAEALNWVMTRVTLSVAFYALLTPVAILYRLVSGDPLHRNLDSSAASYWDCPDDQPADLETYKNQF